MANHYRVQEWADSNLVRSTTRDSRTGAEIVRLQWARQAVSDLHPDRRIEIVSLIVGAHTAADIVERGR